MKLNYDFFFFGLQITSSEHLQRFIFRIIHVKSRTGYSQEKVFAY